MSDSPVYETLSLISRGLPDRDFAKRDRGPQRNWGGLDRFLTRKCGDLGFGRTEFRRSEFTRQVHRQSVLAGHLHGVDPHLAAAGGASRVPAVDVEPGSCSHVGIRAQCQGQFLFPAACDGCCCRRRWSGWGWRRPGSPSRPAPPEAVRCRCGGPPPLPGIGPVADF